MKKDKRPVGAPPKFDRNEVMDRAFEIIATSERSVEDILKNEPGMPSSTTSFFNWINESPELMEKYTRAQEMRAEYQAGLIIAIADDKSNDYITMEDGRQIVNHEHIQRSKLRIETRQWTMSRYSRKFGAKTTLEHTGKDGGPIEHKDVSASDLAKKLSREELEQMAILAEKIQKNDT